MRVEVVDSLAVIPAAEWNRLNGGGNPFLLHQYLAALEQQGCVGAGTGWQPSHLVARSDGGDLVGAMPLYVKTDSWGEFVFDFSWAEAYQRAGMDYYPKLVSALPFTPVPGNRLLAAPGSDRSAVAAALLLGAMDLADGCGASSLHVLFPEADEQAALMAGGLMLRKDCQYHWRNRGYTCFDDFLATFSSKKRKQVRRERRIVADQGFSFRTLPGDAIDADLWHRVYELYASTFLVRGRRPYFSPGVFPQLGRTMGQNLLVTLALKDGVPAAMAIFFLGPKTLYGRYWGAVRDYDCLHFETCFYQGIEHCIERGLAVFEPGAQGEHKITRGFEPTATWSAHWLVDSRFAQAVGDYLLEERRHVDAYMDQAQQRLPYRPGHYLSVNLAWIDSHADPGCLPDPARALKAPDGLLAAGGRLSPDWLMHAYPRGIFPWYEQGQPVLWWSPDPRSVLYPQNLKISRSLARTIRKGTFTCTFDGAFPSVVEGCAARRRHQSGTWITPAMQNAYTRLHRLGHAHSVEVWRDGELAGGLYGVAIGRVFFGESMFTRVTDASKVGFAWLVGRLSEWGYRLIDCQQATGHLVRLGSREIPRMEFIDLLSVYCPVPPDLGAWGQPETGATG